MKDASGASQMDARTQVTSLHGVSMLEAAKLPLEANVALALLHEPGGENDRRLINAAVGAQVNLHGDPALAAAQAARDEGNAPNAVLAAAAAIIGPRRQAGARRALRLLVDRFSALGLASATDESFDLRRLGRGDAPAFIGAARDPKAEALLAGLKARGARSAFVLPRIARRSPHRRRGARRDLRDARLGTALAQAHLAADGREPALVDAAVRHADRRVGPRLEARGRRLLRLANGGGRWLAQPDRGLLRRAARRRAVRGRPVRLQTLVGLLLTNGPGASSAQGAKERCRPTAPKAPSAYS